jgi:N-acetylmuramic acid 6-phosphate etherase
MDNETGAALPITEQENPRSQNLSSQSSREIVALMNEEDATVAAAVRLVLDDVAKAVDETAARLGSGGRLFYIGTGTSGRLGVLDASECPPTFGVSPELVQGVIAGGYDACHRAVEASEDDGNAGGTDLQQRDLTDRDVVIGIAASGKTPYTVGAIDYARSMSRLASSRSLDIVEL